MFVICESSFSPEALKLSSWTIEVHCHTSIPWPSLFWWAAISIYLATARIWEIPRWSISSSFWDAVVSNPLLTELCHQSLLQSNFQFDLDHILWSKAFLVFSQAKSESTHFQQCTCTALNTLSPMISKAFPSWLSPHFPHKTSSQRVEHPVF